MCVRVCVCVCVHVCVLCVHVCAYYMRVFGWCGCVRETGCGIVHATAINAMKEIIYNM